MAQTLLDQNFLHKLERITLTARMMAKGDAGGNRKALAKGTSVEFADFREYAPGDDYRRIDWNAYGRFERLFIKLFTEERQTAVTIFIDDSGSMDWGDPNKGFLAKQLAAALAYIALANFDRVAIAALNQQVQDHLPAFSGKQGFWNALRFIDELPFGGKTNLTAAIKSYSALGSRGGIAVVLTDLFSEDGYKEAMKYLQYQKQEVTLIHILAPQELDPPWQGSVQLQDKEGYESRDITIKPDVITAYKKALNEFLNDNRQFCYDRGIAYIVLSSVLDIDKAIFDNLFKLGVVR